jgi:hypothetical protein
MSDFEKKSESFFYDPSKDRAKNPMDGKTGKLTNYYGPALGPEILNEISVWSQVLNSIKDGVPKPYDSTAVINKISKYERKNRIDLSELKKCCPPSSDFREAKEIKPFIFGILDRIVEISGIDNYVSKYKYSNEQG